MSKQPKNDTIRYSQAERRAEAEIDRFLRSVSPPAERTVLEELRSLA